MLELAIAEAYRPRLRLPSPAAVREQPPSTVPARSATFATNPNARASFLSRRPQTPSAPSRNASVASHSRSFISFISRRGRPGSSFSSSERTITPREAVRADSVFSQATATPAAHATRESEAGDKVLPTLDQAALKPVPHVCPFSARPTRNLPRLPAPVPLPPQEELTHFDTALQSAIEDLQSPSPKGLDVSLTLLKHMAHVSDLASCVATSWPEFYALLLHAAKLAISVLPVREVAARNVLVKSLAGVAWRWDEEEKGDTTQIARIAGQVFDFAVQGRRMLASRLGREFARWLSREVGRQEEKGGRSVRILTLGVSRAVLAGLQCALAEDPGLQIHLRVLTAFDQRMPPPPSYDRLHITVCPTGAIGTASQGVDVLLLEPSCVDPTGILECQNGALGTAVCVKTLSLSARVVALSDVDRIAISVAEGLSASGKGGGLDETPERISGKFVDLYIAENGALVIEELQGLAEEAGELDRHVLGIDGN